MGPRYTIFHHFQSISAFQTAAISMFTLQHYSILWHLLTHSHRIPWHPMAPGRWALRVLVTSPGVPARAWSWPRRRWNATRRTRSTAVCWNARGSSLRRSCGKTSGRWSEAGGCCFLGGTMSPCAFFLRNHTVLEGMDDLWDMNGMWLEIHYFDAMNVEISGIIQLPQK